MSMQDKQSTVGFTNSGTKQATSNSNHGKKFNKNATIYIACTAVFVALSTVLNIFSFPIMGNSVTISLTYVPIVLAGAFLGPVAGLLTGVIGDLLGMLIHPMGAWIPLITVSNGVMGLIAGLVFKIKINPYIKIAIAMVLVFVNCTCGLSTLGLFLMYAKGKKTFFVYLGGRILTQLISFGASLAVIYGLYPILQKVVFSKINLQRK